MKKILYFLSLITVFLFAGFVVISCGSEDKTQEDSLPYIGSYYGGLGDQTTIIRIEKDSFIEEGYSYSYEVKNHEVFVSGGMHGYFYNDYNVLVYEEFKYTPYIGMIPVRGGYFNAQLENSDQSRSFVFNKDGTYVYYTAGALGAMNRGTYAFYNGVLELQGKYDYSSKLFHMYIYVAPNYDIYLSAFIKDNVSPRSFVGSPTADINENSSESTISKPEYVTVTYDRCDDSEPYSVVLEKGTTIKLPTADRAGYTFKGWNCYDSNYNYSWGTVGEIVPINNDITFYAFWELKRYRITYHLNGGRLYNAKSEFTVYDLPFTLPLPDGETDDMSFVKWTTDEEGNNEITLIKAESSNLKDIALYAFYENSADCLSYRYNSDLNGYEIISYSGTAKLVKIPSQYRGISVTSIGERAFSVCSSLTSIEIPNSVTSIGDCAFNNCSSLTSIEIPDSVTSIGDYVFEKCSSLTSVTIGNGVTSIGDRAFFECHSLTSIVLPDSVTDIGYHAFYHCFGLTSVTIPNSVTSIGESTFSGCRGLTSVTIPDSVTSIREWAFSDCSSLPSVTIGKNLEYCNYYAFQNCPNLKTIYLNSSFVANNDSTLFDYAETVYIGKDIEVTNPLFSVVMGKENNEIYEVDGVEYYKYVIKP